MCEIFASLFVNWDLNLPPLCLENLVCEFSCELSFEAVKFSFLKSCFFEFANSLSFFILHLF